MREARDNTTKVLNWIHIASTTHTPCVFLSMDTEKAFDHVNCPFMFSVLRHRGLGDNMIHLITKLYSMPAAQVKANSILSDPFSITNGTKQGCPLSPILFALSLEPFLCIICLNPDIAGITADNLQHKISVYNDDLLLLLTNPTVSLPNILREFELYWALSNLKIHFDKSAAMGIMVAPPATLKYLGTYIPCNLACTYELNFPPLLPRLVSCLRVGIKDCTHGLVGATS